MSNNFDEKSLIALNEIENELNGKKYGLVWEEHEEAVDIQMREAVPIFVEDKSREIVSDKDKPFNFLLEGDNLHSLYLLEKTHKGKIDVIYIDPPYNTGKVSDTDSGFIFDDNFVKDDDGYKHSKWLSFMFNRLTIAYSLLSTDGKLFISIDNREYAQLSSLLSDLFGYDRVETMIWRKSGVGRDGKMKNTNTFRVDHEYLLVVYKGKKILNKSFAKPQFQNQYDNPDNDERGAYKAGTISKKESAGNPNHKNYYTVVSPSGRKITRQFDIPKEEFDRLDADKRIYWGKDGNSLPSKKIFVDEERFVTTSSILDENSMTTTQGKKEIEDLALKFDNPKPIELIKRIIQISSNDDSIVLDFFAGSGTTGQAVMELNDVDGGKRKFILCTNNENDICNKVTYSRVTTVITGKRIDGVNYAKSKVYNDVLLKKKFSIDSINDNELLNEIMSVKNENDNKYKKIEISFENDCVIVTGIRDIKTDFKPILINLKYFKTDFVLKSSKNLSKELTKHVKELIELEWGVSIDKKVNLMVMTEDELDKIEANWDKLKTTVKSIYRARQVVYTSKQKQLFKCINNFIIPDYYFDNELKEVGENW